MESEGYVDQVREARHRPSVLKTKVLSIRSGDADSPVIIFEGKTDVGPYESWIKRIDDKFYYKPLSGSGKAQLLAFRELIETSTDDFLKFIYFIIDKDYDGLRGKNESDNLYCLDRYSFENHLTTQEALESILNDEFECADAPHNIPGTLELFNSTAQKFCSVMYEANLRLYIASKYNIPRGRIENRAQKFARISLFDTEKLYDAADLETLIPMEIEPSADQVIEATQHFSEVENPMHRHRGKYLFSFFLTWLDLLSKNRKSGNDPFQEPKPIKYNRATMTGRSLASRVGIPAGISEFIDHIKQDIAA